MKAQRLLSMVYDILAIAFLAMTSFSDAYAEDTAFQPLARDVAESLETEEEEDPLEELNRDIFEFNTFFDRLLLRPLAEIYKAAVPSPAQDGVHNFLGNLSSPVVLANHLLQGNGDAGMDTLARFLINTTLGIGGLFDVAASLGLEQQTTDFGITLGKAGMESGPYIMLPFLGPSSLRDTIGWTVDYLADPFNYYARHHDRKNLVYVRSGAELLDYRVRSLDFTDNVEQTSSDSYATIRSYYLQNRRFKVSPQSAIDVESPMPYEADTEK